MKVCVIGAGIVGCATAYQLARLGCEVHLLDGAAGPGMGTSFANGAQLSYSYVEPLASPATLRAMPAMLLSRSSPLRFELKPDLKQWKWGLQFLRACTVQQSRQGTQELLELSQLSRGTLEQWMEAEDWSFSFRRNGKLVLCPDKESLRRQGEQIKFQASLGCKQELLTAVECLVKEPTLTQYWGNFVGGVWTDDECVGDPYELCLQMTKSLRRMGGCTSFGERAVSFVIRNDRVAAITTSTGEITADAFVLATGPSTAMLASQLGIYVPIYPIKGYSLTLPINPDRLAPTASVTDLGGKMVFASLGDRLRVAAMAEVVGYDLTIPTHRIDQMLQSVEKVFPNLCDLKSPMPWAGLRPATPTSVPIIARTSVPNLFLNTGHGALGLTLAAGSAVVLSRKALGP